MVRHPMSEFKFACPVCGQHITADSSASGGHLECPTCFQKIVVPQAPSSPDSKFILSASQVSKPRPTSLGASGVVEGAPAPRSRMPLFAALGVLALLGAAGAAAFVFRDKIFKRAPDQAKASTNSPSKSAAKTVQPKKVYSVPTNITWSLELTNAVFPEAAPAGSVHGSGFLSEKAVLQGGTLHLRQGKALPSDLGISVQFFAQQGEELSGKTIEITADRPPPIPKVVLRWKNDKDKPVTRNYTEGYALRVEFGDAANGRMPGKVFIALPDEEKSFAAGTFTADIRKPSVPKVKPPRVQKPPKPPS
jgi:hypothetical protein